MRIKSLSVRNFKRFEDLRIADLGPEVKLVVLTGPNGSGKTSIFEAFNFWIDCINQNYELDSEYHLRNPGTGTPNDWKSVHDSIEVIFHEVEPFKLHESFLKDPTKTRKAFYIRSAYRHEPDFTTNGLARAAEVLLNAQRPRRLINGEHRVSENYQRLAANSFAALYDPANKKRTAEDLTEKIVGEIRTAMQNVFADLMLDGLTNPVEGGTFRFSKGTASGFHYKNLSGGEKAAFDILVDLIVKRNAFDDTVYCLDEPELHMHSRLQAKLLRETFQLIPNNCQIWLATHSIGMSRAATELQADHPNEVAFIDFHNRNFDSPTVITPTTPNREFWQDLFTTALDDLAKLVLPDFIVLCEGKKIGVNRRKPSFDVSVYKTIFSKYSGQLAFYPLGGDNEVQAITPCFTQFLRGLENGVRVWSVIDRDDRSEQEIKELESKSIYVLRRRDLENYLWHDDVIHAHCNRLQRAEVAVTIIERRNELLRNGVQDGRAADDVKSIAGELYIYTKSMLQKELGQGFGNTAEAYAIRNLAPCVTENLDIYGELARVVLGPMQSSKP